ncbi:multidrug efflux transporter AcrB transmembrane domain-containing protein [Microthyrium microscopicum]|uniref:Multidrug efflux transporter AcrB transmembrane domain-containing protein n=1 Tax=Microthyrium microscopicum TaxID=703497 RepID=A0A6A6UFF3_9PEZI|nr:multidrug efflux transporter AcrB transmembrane domain-containing protein [Microthyrium microscopicum]
MRNPSLPRWKSIYLIWVSTALPLLISAVTHEAGRCAIRGNCGKEGLFSPQLPCPDNGPAEVPDDKTRASLIEICGDDWKDSKVCCKPEQLETLQTNLKRADSIISSCPACRANFVNLFCTFTCSPDQSLFVNVTRTTEKAGKSLVTELDHLVSDKYGEGFYDSCKEVKFGASNGKAMDLIGGGAQNYTDFLNFLGKKKFLGSPFQMNFNRSNEADFPGMKPMDKKTRSCNDEDEQYRCACVDCPQSCKALPEVADEGECYVGILPCLSFAVIIVYSGLLLMLVMTISGHVAYQKHAQRKNEQLRLLHDAAQSDDEDEGDIVHNAGMLERPQRHYWLNTLCDKAFSKLGMFCAEFPAITIGLSLFGVALLSLGWIRFAVETDPVRLWVSPDSAAAKEKAYFDDNFGRFYRAEQVFIVNDTDVSKAPVVSYDTLRWMFDIEGRVNRLRAPGGITLDDVCFKPVDNVCVVQSVSGYFQGDVNNLSPKTWEDDLQHCAESPVDCLPEFQQPLNPNIVFGRYGEDVLDAQSLVITWVINNHPEDSEELKKTMVFENALKDTLLGIQMEAKERGLRLSFSTEVSLEQELNKSTNTDAKIVVISYIVMFLYASLALGSTSLGIRSILSDPTSLLVQSKFMLGVVGIAIVLMSVSASVGLFSAMGIKVTLIIAEVIPFLVLAVGVDNIFLIVHEFERVNVSHPDGPVHVRMSKALGRMGPSILLSASTETVAFALGAAVGMPAVRNFAAYAAGAVFINAILQVTMFVSVLALNQRRVEAGRADCIPCIKVTNRDPMSGGHMMYGMEDESALQRFIHKRYAPTLLRPKVKVGVVAFFLALFTAGLSLLPEIELGLDQRIAIPSDSYLIPYFNDLEKYFGVGPPVYFVTRDLNITQLEHQKELCGRFLACDDYSLSNILEQERNRPNVSYIADATASWIDDFFLWLNPDFEDCCTTRGKSCFEGRDPPWNRALKGMPEGTEFIDYVQRWLKAPTTAECPVAGAAAYGTSVKVDADNTAIPASAFRTSHTPLRSQREYIAAYKAARRIAADISERNGIDVFPYSVFYIFFDQYTTIVSLAGKLLGSAAAIIFVLTTVLLGSLRTGLVVTATVSMTIVSILGCMAIAGVSLNAVSLVNLIISVGIALEFCAHIARAFTFPSTSVMERAPRLAFTSSQAMRNGREEHLMSHRLPSVQTSRSASKDVRAWAALANVGSSVISGITITKILGVAVLAFTRSKIFEVYYFRVWVALVIMASTHALIFLPVALSLFGGRGKSFPTDMLTSDTNCCIGYVDPESEGGLEQDLRSRRYPALLGDEEYDSDEY